MSLITKAATDASIARMPRRFWAADAIECSSVLEGLMDGEARANDARCACMPLAALAQKSSNEVYAGPSF